MSLFTVPNPHSLNPIDEESLIVKIAAAKTIESLLYFKKVPELSQKYWNHHQNRSFQNNVIILLDYLGEDTGNARIITRDIFRDKNDKTKREENLIDYLIEEFSYILTENNGNTEHITQEYDDENQDEYYEPPMYKNPEPELSPIFKTPE